MIVELMWYVILVSLIATATALPLESGLRRVGLPARLVWAGALVAPWLLLIAPIVSARFGVEVANALPDAVVVQLPELLVAPTAAVVDLSTLVLVSWLAITSTLFLALAGAHLSIRRKRAGWRAMSVEGRDVWISDEQGPAVAGVLRPWIILPAWALDLPRGQLRMVLLHEEEHVRARDGALLALALSAAIAAPWNVLAWYQLRRLRTAVELDCDRRVLMQTPEAELYGVSLLNVAGKLSGRTLGFAAFTERSNTLRRRIMTMTRTTDRWSYIRAAGLIALATTVGLQACAVESPVTVDEATALEENGASAAAGVDIRAEPTFTPFTVAPSIKNRDAVVSILNREYPPLLREAGIGGRVVVYFFVNERGIVEQVRISESSGHPALDDAALNVAGAFEFEPALNGDEVVPVWVLFPITFQTDGGEAPGPRPEND